MGGIEQSSRASGWEGRGGRAHARVCSSAAPKSWLLSKCLECAQRSMTSPSTTVPLDDSTTACSTSSGTMLAANRPGRGQESVGAAARHPLPVLESNMARL